MRSHDIDYASLTLGAIFTGVGIVLATGSLDILRLDWPKVAGPVTIIVVGLLIGMVALVRRSPGGAWPEIGNPGTGSEPDEPATVERWQDDTRPL